MVYIVCDLWLISGDGGHHRSANLHDHHGVDYLTSNSTHNLASNSAYCGMLGPRLPLILSLARPFPQ